jgi:Flp pilus assembly protein TadG
MLLMRAPRPEAGGRRAAIAPLTAFMLIPLLAMVAFSVDLGWLVVVETELQNSADAAALAGTQQLIGPYVQWSLPGLTQAQKNDIRTSAIQSATATARQYAGYNSAGGIPLILLDADIEVGYTDAQGNYNPNPSNDVFPNTVAVTARRDSSANNPVSLFFAPVIGTNSVALQAYARGGVQEGNVQNLMALPNTNAHILPVALDVNIWNQFYQTGKSPDGSVHTNAINNYPELQVYPDKWQTSPTQPGSFGLIDTGTPSNSTPAFRSWITNGDTPNDINYLVSNGLVPVSPTSPQSWKVGPGLKSTLTSTFQLVIGEPNLIPIFQPVIPYTGTGTYQPTTGVGQNATYAVIGFVGVTVSYANGTGSGMVISIQPMASVDPTGFIPNPKPGGTTNSSLGGPLSTIPQTTFTSPKLIK